MLHRIIRGCVIALLVMGGNAMAATTVNSPIQSAGPQVNFTDLAGSEACSQRPALTGNVTTSAGSCATTLATIPSGMTIPAPTVTNSFTATGLVTNADLANPSTTVNGQTCTLGSTCTVSSGITQSSKTTAYTVVSGDNGTYFDNTGASASVTFTLPSSPASAQRNCFFAAVADAIEVLAPSSVKIYQGTTASASAGNLTSSAAIGNTVCVYYVGSSTWIVQSEEGTWTVN